MLKIFWGMVAAIGRRLSLTAAVRLSPWAEYVEDCCALSPELETTAMTLYKTYAIWCRYNNVPLRAYRAFCCGMGSWPGVTGCARDGRRWFRGIAPTDEWDEEANHD